MSKKKLILTIISLVVNAFNFIAVFLCMLLYFIDKGDGNMAVSGVRAFKYFTNDSNILMALTSIGIIVCDILMLLKEREDIDQLALLLKQVGTVAATVTFLTVMFFLGPTQGYGIMLAGKNLYLHLICPVLAILSYVFTEYTQNKKENMFVYSVYGIIPTFLYGIVYLIMVVVVEDGWEDFYGFNQGGLWYVSVFVMLAATYVISLGLTFLHNLAERKKNS